MGLDDLEILDIAKKSDSWDGVVKTLLLNGYRFQGSDIGNTETYEPIPGLVKKEFAVVRCIDWPNSPTRLWRYKGDKCFRFFKPKDKQE